MVRGAQPSKITKAGAATLLHFPRESKMGQPPIVETAKEHPVATGAVVVGVTILTFGAATPEEIILLGAGTAAAGAGP